MTHQDFIKLVRDMRTAQKAYFRRRTSEALESSKELERKVDTYLLDEGSGQKQLWNEETSK